MGDWHLGHFKAESLKPGLGGTSVPHFGQMPYVPFAFAKLAEELFNLFPSCSNVLVDLIGFCPFLCIKISPL
jgi:hypothetical protein